MGIHFRETMSGSATLPEGERRFSFTVEADSSTLASMWGAAPLQLTGTASLEGVVEEAPVIEGSNMEIGLPFHRHLRYQVHFRDGDGHLWRYFGEKQVSILRLASTMTTLVGQLYKDGSEVGPATLRFNLGDTPGFLASFRPWRVAPE